LDIGDPIMESIPVGTRIAIGLLQTYAVSIAGLAPAVKYVTQIYQVGLSLRKTRVLYVIMMYISVYPIAMSVRNTNVYEEQSLGSDDIEDVEQGP
jgi:Trk-type K+ transport system membrane component